MAGPHALRVTLDSNDTLALALRDRGLDAEVWHTGGGIWNVAVALERNDASGRATRWLLFPDARYPEDDFGFSLDHVFDTLGDRTLGYNFWTKPPYPTVSETPATIEAIVAWATATPDPRVLPTTRAAYRHRSLPIRWHDYVHVTIAGREFTGEQYEDSDTLSAEECETLDLDGTGRASDSPYRWSTLTAEQRSTLGARSHW